MGSETKRTISIAIGVAAGILLSGAIAFAVKVTLINMAAKELAKQIEETNRQAKSEQIQRTLERIKADRRKALYEEMRKKESSDACRFWRQQKGINDRAEQKIKEHCYTGPDPKTI